MFLDSKGLITQSDGDGGDKLQREFIDLWKPTVKEF